MSVAKLETSQTYIDSELARIFLEPLPEVGEYDKHVDRMHRIAGAVGGVGLSQVRDGYAMYAEVTEIVYDRMHQFRFPDKILETIVKFSKSAEDSLVQHILGKPENIPPLWGRLYYKNRQDTPFTNLSDFWGAHIPWDLMFVLENTNTNNDHRSDFDDVDPMLDDAAIITMQKHFPRLPGSVARFGRGLVMRDIKPMRARAFDDSQKLLAAGDDEEARKAVITAPHRVGLTEHPMSRKLLDMAVRAYYDEHQADKDDIHLPIVD